MFSCVTTIVCQSPQKLSLVHVQHRAFVHEDDDAALTTHTAINAGRVNIEINRHLAAMSAHDGMNVSDVRCAAFTCCNLVQSVAAT